MIKFKNKNYLFDGFGKFYFECKIKNKAIIAKKLPQKKIQSLILKQYSVAKFMERKHQNSKKFLLKNSYELFEKALNSFEEYKPKISTKKYSFKFPFYKNSKLKKNGIGIYNGKLFNSNSVIKFKNVENMINYPKKDFDKYKYGLIVNFKIKFKKKNQFMNIKANYFNLKKSVKGLFFDLSKDKNCILNF